MAEACVPVYSLYTGMKKISLLLILPLTVTSICAQKINPLWKDFVAAKKSGGTPVLPDFSYAGYHFSEKSIPDLAKKRHFNVIDFGAKPDDDQFDDKAIQAAILAAEKNPEGGVVFFPKGKFLIAPDNDSTQQIRISKSNIVLKGSGAGQNGTEIHQANMRINGRQFIFKPTDNEAKKITTITKDAPRESFWVDVKDASALKAGQDVVIRHRSEEYTRLYFGKLPLKKEWTRLFGDKGGMLIHEIHTIEKIDGNRVRFKNPLHFDLTLVKSASFDLITYNSIEECGIEDLRFSSNWKSYPEEFIHHKNAIHDYAYEAVGMEYVKNSWVRNCAFHDLNEGIMLRAGYQVSILNVSFKGKKGHASVHARTGYGVLVKNCDFNNAQHHGAGTGYSASGTVITQCSLGRDQNFDIHSGQPIATLFDQIDGGVFYNLGGPEGGHPHHGKHLVLWNFHHKSEKEQHYNFWDMSRRRNYTIAEPLLIGFTSDKKVSFENAGLNESQNAPVLPGSLFEAQLALRLEGKDLSATKKNALDSKAFIKLYGNLTNTHYRINTEKKATVAFLGGSITDMKGWRDLVGEMLKEKYPETEFIFINAGIPSLGSLPHAFRLEQDVLSKGRIDLIFIESAVNDYVNGTPESVQRRALEGLVRHAKRKNKYTDIVMMAFADENKISEYNAGKIPQEIKVHEAIAKQYQLPFINLAEEVSARIAAHEFTWKDDFKNLHPSPFGHKIYLRSITALFEMSTSGKKITGLSSSRSIRPLDTDNYENGLYVNIAKAAISKGFTRVPSWGPSDSVGTRPGFVRVPMLVADTPGSAFELVFSGTAVGLALVSGPDAGLLQYTIDNGPVKTLDLYTQWSRSLHLPWYVLLADGLKKGKHVVNVKISEKKNEQSKGTACRVVYFLVNT